MVRTFRCIYWGFAKAIYKVLPSTPFHSPRYFPTRVFNSWDSLRTKWVFQASNSRESFWRHADSLNEDLSETSLIIKASFVITRVLPWGFRAMCWMLFTSVCSMLLYVYELPQDLWNSIGSRERLHWDSFIGFLGMFHERLAISFPFHLNAPVINRFNIKSLY